MRNLGDFPHLCLHPIHRYPQYIEANKKPVPRQSRAALLESGAFTDRFLPVPSSNSKSTCLMETESGRCTWGTHSRWTVSMSPDDRWSKYPTQWSQWLTEVQRSWNHHRANAYKLRSMVGVIGIPSWIMIISDRVAAKTPGTRVVNRCKLAK